MDSNSTLLEDILLNVTSDPDIPSTSSTNTTSWDFLNTSSIDPDRGPGPRLATIIDEGLGTFVHPGPLNITEHISNTTHHKGIDIEKFMKFVDEYPWVVYGASVFVLIVLAIIVVTLICCVCKNKKRVIRQDNDPILTSTYESNASWLKKLCCKEQLAKEEQQHHVRQNSESNLESYRRQNVPKSVPVKVPGVPHYNISTFSRDELYYNNPVVREFTDVGAERSAHNIDAIRGIPNQSIREEQYRQLPQLKK